MMKDEKVRSNRRDAGNIGLLIPMYVFTILFVALPILYLFLLSFYRVPGLGCGLYVHAGQLQTNIGTVVSGYFLAISEVAFTATFSWR